MGDLEKEYLQARPYIEYYYPALASELYDSSMTIGITRGTITVIIDTLQEWKDSMTLEGDPGRCGNIWALPKIKK